MKTENKPVRKTEKKSTVKNVADRKKSATADIAIGKKPAKFIIAKGARKTAVANVKLTEGRGEILINGRDFKDYFPVWEWQKTALSPLVFIGAENKFNLSCRVKSGGKAGQADAVRHGLSRALEIYNPQWRPVLKAAGFLTRDPRVKERKKPGLKRARRAPQWSKR